jgi:radical SAM superfamily enzyme YgiQ (UPF0313 family)
MNMSSRPRVLLVKVPCYTDAFSPPLGIGYLAAQLRDVADVTLVDAANSRLSAKRFGELVAREQPDVIGLSLVTYAAKNAVDFIRVARQAAPDAHIVAGGAHPTALPEAFLAEAGDDLDCVLSGEAEFSFRAFVAAVARGFARPGWQAAAMDIPGLVRRGPDGIVHNPKGAHDADDYGIPAWDLMPPASYPESPHGAFFRRFPVAPIVTSRGCPYRCGFCSVPTLVGRKMRYRSPDLVVDEMELLRRDYGVREFQIVDDNFTISKRHAMAVCERMIDRGVVAPWTTPNGVRIDALDDELLDAMKAAGCYSISLGIESGSPRVLDRMVKHLDLRVVPGIVDAIVSRGMEAHAFFILGYPNETPEDAEETIRLAKSLPLTRANFSLFTPLPETPEYDRLSAEQKDRILDSRSFAQVNYVAPAYTARSLKNLQRRALLEFYGRPKQAMRLARAIHSLPLGFYVARRARRWLMAS